VKNNKGVAMKPKSALAIVVATLASVIAYLVTASGQAEESSAPVYLTELPSGYRDWKMISVAHEEGDLHSFAIVLGNDVAVKAYREKKLPYPDGTIIAALHYSFVPSADNNKVFGRKQSFVPGPPSNVQWEVKDSKKYAATGGWGFGQANANGKPVEEAQFKTCAPCHAEAPHDFVFTRYAP
jgi:Cytochrome P460